MINLNIYMQIKGFSLQEKNVMFLDMLNEKIMFTENKILDESFL